MAPSSLKVKAKALAVLYKPTRSDSSWFLWPYLLPSFLCLSVFQTHWSLTSPTHSDTHTHTHTHTPHTHTHTHQTHTARCSYPAGNLISLCTALSYSPLYQIYDFNNNFILSFPWELILIIPSIHPTDLAPSWRSAKLTTSVYWWFTLSLYSFIINMEFIFCCFY